VSEVVATLREQGVETVVLAGADTHGIMRGKRLPLDGLERALHHGVALCDVLWVLHVDESDLVVRPEGHAGWFPTERNGYPDILAVPDVGTLRVVPWHHRTALVLCDWRTLGGEPVPVAPRHVLRRVVERARGMGLEPQIALELEFYVLREASPRGLVPLTERPSTYGVVTGSGQEPVARLIRESMAAYGLPLEACNPETGPGQFEITLRYRPALEAADDAFLFKAAVKELAAQQGLVATFMAKPHTDWAGSSCHVHMSFAGGELFDAAAERGISRTMRHFLGGSIAGMAELTALHAPTINSYRRFTPYSWAGTTATWGVDNRSTGLRAILEGETGTRVEHRQAGGDANPYLVAAAALAAGLDGIERGIEPPPASDADVYALPAAQAPPLPASLTEATEALAASALARDWLGEDFTSHYVAMKRAEVQAAAAAVTDWEVARYLDAF
jgi:glutamine synthetase